MSKEAQSLGKRAIISQDHAAFASRNYFPGVQAKHGYVG
jgi:hypothetical protein